MLFLSRGEQLAERATAVHHLLLANAIATRDYHRKNMGGLIGITLSLSPAIPINGDNPEDAAAATRQDGVHNRWFLDALFNGKYPADILALYQQFNKNLNLLIPIMHCLPPINRTSSVSIFIRLPMLKPTKTCRLV